MQCQPAGGAARHRDVRSLWSAKSASRLLIIFSLLAATVAGLGNMVPAAAAGLQATAIHQASRSVPSARRELASLVAVACRGDTWCMAVGSYTDQFHVHALAQVWNGEKWRILPGVPGRSLTSLSCPATSFCVAGGGPTGAEQWNGRAWRTVRMGRPDGGLAGVSCTSRSLCMAIDPVLDGPVVQSWNGRTWHVWSKATNVCFGPPGAPCGLAGVSCGSESNCVAVGTTQYGFSSDQRPSSVVWNGKRWAFSQPAGVGDPAGLNAVSCTGRFCLAVGGGYADIYQGTIAIATAWNAATRSWTDVSPDLGPICHQVAACVWASVISCGSAKNCMTLGPAGDQAWTGHGWLPAPSVSAGYQSGLPAVSCGLTFCMAVGHQTINFVRHSLTELWNGTSWQLQQPVDPF
jgi:hypothetical protein